MVTGLGDLDIDGVGGDVSARTGSGAVVLSGMSAAVELHSGNGSLEISEATGPIRAHTGNGPITVGSARTPISVRSGNGRIQVGLAVMVTDGSSEFRTGNGDVELHLPADLDAVLVTRLHHGSLISDFPITLEGRIDFRNLRVTVGRGGHRLTVASGNGDAVLRQTVRQRPDILR